MDESSGASRPSLRARWPEAALAVVLQAIAIAVIADSLRVGVGWADDGPRSGYFPFIIGVLLFGAASWILVTQLRRWRTDETEFADHGQLVQVASMGVPIVIYVAAIPALGLYVASVALIAWFMLRHGRYRMLPTAAISIAVPAIAFLVFERWFLVPLPKGPLEAAFGL